MKQYLILFIIVFIISCSSSSKNHEGYVYDNSTQKPIYNLAICLEHNKLKRECVYTSKKGFFKFRENGLSKYIYIYENNNLIDSIQCIRIQGGERLQYCFVDKKADTVFIDMKLKKIVRQ
ncbi:hypothetical protein Q1W71_22825 [Flavobacterium pectinovorum]|uniref:hypothetical protein n=1 Tax=Flavobacterium pectinovorum TaxID=29533 RepID=UPI00265DFCB8|nr:hypothetical protein [Flavobacterium pectinovorum]WKL47768.1 hypothetical protein Q1W71_22825 [Flavobacterium pectinovorum]